MRKEFVLSLVLLFVFSGSLLAQEERTGYELGAFAAWQNWKARDFQIGFPQAQTPIDSSLRYRNRLAYGVRGNFLSHGYWGGEISYSYQKNTVTITRQSLSSAVLDGAVHQVFYNQIFYPAQYRQVITPFITGGIGGAAYQINPDDRARAAQIGLGRLENTDWRVALNYGVGVKVNVVPHFGIRGDFRHIFSDAPSYGLPKESFNAIQPVLPVHGKLQTYEFSFGIYARGLYEFR